MHERNDKWSVGEWMTANPKTVEPSTSVRTAFFRMRSEGVRHLPVVDDGKLVGMVTDRDLRRPDLSDEPDGWHDYYRLDESYEVRHVMTTKLSTARTADPLEKAVETLVERKFGALPVVDKNDRLIGILTSFDLLRAFGSALESAGSHLRR
jgi:acetoin utilization protein AcuB